MNREYRWQTENAHCDNEETMNDFLENEIDNFLRGEYDVYLVDGTYAEMKLNGIKYAIHASGDGDSIHHKIEIERL